MSVIQKANPAANMFFDVLLFGARKTKTAYLLGPYKGKLRHLYIFITAMKLRGYRVLYLQPSPEVLSHTNAQWLGRAVAEAISIIKSDSEKQQQEVEYLVGVSLGSYLGLNIQLELPFKKFVVVAGGVPLRGVFNSAKMFQKFQREVESSNTKKSLEYHWRPYDESYKNSNFSHCTTLFINSNNDQVIHTQLLNKFLSSYKKTGVHIINHQKGRLNHVMQALSINWRAKEIDNFFKKDSEA